MSEAPADPASPAGGSDGEGSEAPGLADSAHDSDDESDGEAGGGDELGSLPKAPGRPIAHGQQPLEVRTAA